MNTPNNTRDALAAEIRRLDALGLDWSHELDCLAALADDRAAGPEAARFAEPEGGTYAANEIVAAQWRVPPMTMFQRVGYPSEVADLVARARAVLAAQPKPIAAEPVNAVDPDDMRIGGHYNWKGQPERLAYLGRNWSGNGYWHQFEKITEPGEVWCEVTDSDLSRFEETGATPAPEVPVDLAGYDLAWNLSMAQGWAKDYDPLKPNSQLARVNPRFLVALIEHAMRPAPVAEEQGPVARLESNGAAGLSIAQVYRATSTGQFDVYTAARITKPEA